MIVTVANLPGSRTQSTCAVNLACELAGVADPSADRWQSRYKVILLDADPAGDTVARYCSGRNLPVSCEQRRPADSNLEQWIQEVVATAAEVDYLVIVDPPHAEALTRALAGISDLVIIPCPVAGSDLGAITPVTESIRAARTTRTDAGPKCLLLPTSSPIGAMNGNGSGAALQNLGEPLGPVLHESAEFENAYRERRWIGDYAWNSPAHADITALATCAKQLLNGKKE
jgi:cellulose biosynthesis protein BcsQ